VGAYYGFFQRLHDGPSRRPCPHGLAPSEAERRRSRTPKKLKRRKQESKTEKKGRKKRRQKEPTTADNAIDDSVTAKLVEELKGAQTLPNPNDLLMRLALLLLEVGVKESARKGLLGDPQALMVCGDGSALPTGANRHGKRICSCDKRASCDCPRVYSDPDANIGYDTHRDLYFFGHHLYEFVVSTKGGHDLPITLRLDPANTSDFVASLKSIEHLRKLLQEHSNFKLAAAGFDCGHDGIEVYKFLIHHDIIPIIPLKTPAPAIHPQRQKIQLSKRGVPLCPAGAEMTLLGRSRKNNQVFGCPVKAKKLKRCPDAPESRPDFRCQPLSKLGPTVSIKPSDNPRLCPPIPRNHPRHRASMKLRSGCERSFSVKKEPLKLLQAKHRRASFWLFRVYLMAVLQHGLAWVAKENVQGVVEELLGRDVTRAAA
jgi:hypothetical protein